jgi:hypothetical protein
MPGITHQGRSLFLAWPWPWAEAYVLRWSARCHGCSALRMYLAERAIVDARSVVDLMKDIVELRKEQLTRAKSN